MIQTGRDLPAPFLSPFRRKQMTDRFDEYGHYGENNPPLPANREAVLEGRIKEAVQTLRKGFKAGDPTLTAAAIILAIAQLEGHGE